VPKKDDDNLLDPAEMKALLNSAGSGSTTRFDAAGAPGGPAMLPRDPADSQSPRPTGNLDPRLDEASRQLERRLDRVAAEIDAAIDPNRNMSGGNSDQASRARPFELQAFDDNSGENTAGKANDRSEAELEIRIELGRAALPVEEATQLREGSVVALDKLAADPVDIVANGRLIARGEVLVLENGNFGVQVAEILAPALE
jgi:flagellar motor switch protein FliN/FliY